MTLSQSLANRMILMDEENLREIVQFMGFPDFKRHIEDIQDIRIAHEREDEESIPSEKVREILGL